MYRPEASPGHFLFWRPTPLPALPRWRLMVAPLPLRDAALMADIPPGKSLPGPMVAWTREGPRGPFLTMGTGVEELLGTPAAAFLATAGLADKLLTGTTGSGPARLVFFDRPGTGPRPILEVVWARPEGGLSGLWLGLEGLNHPWRGKDRLLRLLRAREEGMPAILAALAAEEGLGLAALVAATGPSRHPRLHLLGHFGLESGLAPDVEAWIAGVLTQTACVAVALRPPDLALLALPGPGRLALLVGAPVGRPLPMDRLPELEPMAALLGSWLVEMTSRRERDRFAAELRASVLASPRPEALVDRQGLIVAASPGLFEFLGVPVSSLAGTRAARWLLPESEGPLAELRGWARLRELSRRERSQVHLELGGGRNLPAALQVHRLSRELWRVTLEPLGPPSAQVAARQGSRLWLLGFLAAGLAREWTALMAGALGGASLAHRELSATHPASRGLALMEEHAWRAARLAQQVLELATEGSQAGGTDVPTLAGEVVGLAATALPVPVRLEGEGLLPGCRLPDAQIRLLLHLAILVVAGASPDGPVVVHLAPAASHPPQLLWEPGPPPGSGLFAVVERRGRAMAPPDHLPPEWLHLPQSARIQAELRAVLAGASGAAMALSRDGDGRPRAHLFLPAREAPAAAAPLPAAPALGSDRAQGRILLVEPDQATLLAAREALAEEGWTVLAARDGLEAVALFQRHREEVGLVVMELSLPRLGGAEALRQIRRLEPETPVVVTSAYGEEITRQALGTMEVEGFLRKPYGLTTLVQRLAEVLGS